MWLPVLCPSTWWILKEKSSRERGHFFLDLFDVLTWRWVMTFAFLYRLRSKFVTRNGNHRSFKEAVLIFQPRGLQTARPLSSLPNSLIVSATTKKEGVHGSKKNYFTSSDPHRDIILKHIRHKFWHSFCLSVSRFHQNYPLLLVPSPSSGSSSDHCDLSSQTDSNWLSLCLIQNNFRRPGVQTPRRLETKIWKI